jgi:hypothetical protein
MKNIKIVFDKKFGLENDFYLLRAFDSINMTFSNVIFEDINDMALNYSCKLLAISNNHSVLSFIYFKQVNFILKACLTTLIDVDIKDRNVQGMSSIMIEETKINLFRQAVLFNNNSLINLSNNTFFLKNCVLDVEGDLILRKPLFSLGENSNAKIINLKISFNNTRLLQSLDVDEILVFYFWKNNFYPMNSFEIMNITISGNISIINLKDKPLDISLFKLDAYTKFYINKASLTDIIFLKTDYPTKINFFEILPNNLAIVQNLIMTKIKNMATTLTLSIFSIDFFSNLTLEQCDFTSIESSGPIQLVSSTIKNRILVIDCSFQNIIFYSSESRIISSNNETELVTFDVNVIQIENRGSPGTYFSGIDNNIISIIDSKFEKILIGKSGGLFILKSKNKFFINSTKFLDIISRKTSSWLAPTNIFMEAVNNNSLRISNVIMLRFQSSYGISVIKIDIFTRLN